MYTQCPECDAVYRVTSAHLRLAGGEVQCGTCGARFDALDRLSDTYPKGSTASSGSKGPAAPEAEQAADGPPSDTGSDMGATPDNGAEPVAEVESIEPEAPLEPGPSSDSTSTGPEEESTESALPEADITEGVPWKVLPEDGTERDAPADQDEEPTVALDVTVEELFALEELRDQEIPDIGGIEFVEGLPTGQAPGPGSSEDALPGEMVAQGPSLLFRWARRFLLPIVLLAIAAATLHSQRGTLMRNPALAPWLERLYGIVGMEVEPAWEVSAYRIVESAAAIDGGGDLQVTLKFVNEAGFPQPYPVLRVSLEDRWGDEIGSRELLPQDYLEGYASGQMMFPAKQAEGRATVSAPPPAAVGFRLDLCLADASRQLDCMSNQP